MEHTRLSRAKPIGASPSGRAFPPLLGFDFALVPGGEQIARNKALRLDDLSSPSLRRPDLRSEVFVYTSLVTLGRLLLYAVLESLSTQVTICSPLLFIGKLVPRCLHNALPRRRSIVTCFSLPSALDLSQRTKERAFVGLVSPSGLHFGLGILCYTHQNYALYSIRGV